MKLARLLSANCFGSAISASTGRSGTLAFASFAYAALYPPGASAASIMSSCPSSSLLRAEPAPVVHAGDRRGGTQRGEDREARGEGAQGVDSRVSRVCAANHAGQTGQDTDVGRGQAGC